LNELCNGYCTVKCTTWAYHLLVLNPNPLPSSTKISLIISYSNHRVSGRSYHPSLCSYRGRSLLPSTSFSPLSSHTHLDSAAPRPRVIAYHWKIVVSNWTLQLSLLDNLPSFLCRAKALPIQSLLVHVLHLQLSAFYRDYVSVLSTHRLHGLYSITDAMPHTTNKPHIDPPIISKSLPTLFMPSQNLPVGLATPEMRERT
jgi:hypothetical protein